jgi:hypothetical protein
MGQSMGKEEKILPNDCVYILYDIVLGRDWRIQRFGATYPKYYLEERVLL